MPQRRPNKGSALITALFIMTLVAIAATAMSTKLQLDIYRTRLVIEYDKLYLASEVVNFWAINELRNPKQHFSEPLQNNSVALYPQDWSTLYPNVTVTGAIYDLQSHFNVNNLQNIKYYMPFMRALAKISPNMTANERNHLAFGIKNWISSYQLARGKDNYSNYYSTLKPPYVSSHQNLSSFSELRLIKDVDAKTINQLKPYFTALPEETPININTAPKVLLMSLGNGITEANIDELIKARGKKGFTQFHQIQELMHKLDIPQDQITIESTYFMAVAVVDSKEYHSSVKTIYKRKKDKKGKFRVSVLQTIID